MIQTIENGTKVTSPTKHPKLHDLPTELLLEIFTNVCFLDHGDLLVYTPCLPTGPYSGPLLLSHICHLWRQIVVHEHHLWAFLHIKRTLPKALIQLFSERAEPLLLSVFWDTDKPSPSKNFSAIEDIFERWYKERIYGFWEKDTERLEIYLVEELGHRIGEIIYFDAEEHAREQRHEGKFRKDWRPDGLAPIYDTANLPWRPLPPLPRSQPERWSQSRPRQSLSWYPESIEIYEFLPRYLTSLTIKGYDHILTCKDLLEQVATTIVEAEFQATDLAQMHHPKSMEDVDIVVLPMFERLTIHSASDDPTIVLPNRLTCPRMRSIRISCLGFTTYSANRLNAFIRRSRCTLSDLVVVDPTIGNSIHGKLASHPVFRKIENGLFFVGDVSGDRSAFKSKRIVRWELMEEHPSLWCGWGTGISWIST